VASVAVTGDGAERAAARLGDELATVGVTARRVDGGPAAVRLAVAGGTGLPAEGYRLEVSPRGVAVEAADGVGLFYGVCTFGQWLRLHPGRERWLPSLVVRDHPGFRHRGVLLDVSRNKVPTLATLRTLVDRLAGWKVNQLQLYTEHTFAYRGHSRVWRGASPLRPAEVRALDDHCRSRCVELVPNQNSFGHLHRWLVHEPYRRLAECPDGIEHPFSERREPFSLCPLDPGSVELLADLYDQLLPNFESRLFNVGLDETLDLGRCRSAAACRERGRERVYLDFLRRIHRLVTGRGRRMMFWGDVILERPELIPELPADAVALEWGYEPDHPFASDCRRFADSGLDFYVCPGTGGWNSIAGRLPEALVNLASAARHGRDAGALGYLITDWGDRGHLQPPPASYPGLLAGAGFAWNPGSAMSPERPPLRHLLDLHAFDGDRAALGGPTVRLGEVHGTTGARSKNGSALFFLLAMAHHPPEERRCEGMAVGHLERTRGEIEEITAVLAAATPSTAEGRRSRRELTWAADLLHLATRLGNAWLETGFHRPLADLPDPLRRRLAAEIEDLTDRLRPLWKARNRPGGLEDSTARLLRVRDLLR
jgi:hypothetical protein